MKRILQEKNFSELSDSIAGFVEAKNTIDVLCSDMITGCKVTLHVWILPLPASTVHILECVVNDGVFVAVDVVGLDVAMSANGFTVHFFLQR